MDDTACHCLTQSWSASHTDRPSIPAVRGLKRAGRTDDNKCMMISDDQMRRVEECLSCGPAPTPSVVLQQKPDPALVAGIVDMLCGIPELRHDRIEHARHMIDGNMPDSDELAAKLVGRVLSDSLR